MNVAAWLDALRKDLSYGCRVLMKSPGYTLAGVLSLAIGIGANTAMFGVVRAVLLRPLPYPRPQQLMQIGHARDRNAVTIPELQFWKANTAAFAAAAGYRHGFNTG